jgi:hypothetical protein
MRRILFFARIILISVSVHAQEIESSEADAVLDDLFAMDSLEVVHLIDDLKKQDYLYTTVLYNNKVLFSGRDFGVDQYSFFPSVSYIDSNNFFIHVGTGYYSGIDPNWDFITFSGGYSNFIDKKKSLMGTLVYSYSSYTEDVANLNNQRVSAGLSLRKRPFRNSLSAGYLFGGERSFYISNNTYLNIDILDSRKLDISLQPRLGLFWGSQTTTELVRTGFNFTTVETDVFQQLNTELSIPLTFDIGNWDFELDYTFSFPNALPNETELENTGFLSFSVGYLIGL